jgi:menaquinone-specific isochorismate synthase
MTRELNKIWFDEFFREGAYLRLPDGQVFLWQGPWQKSTISNSSHDVEGFNLAHTSFYGSDLNFWKSEEAPIIIDSVELQKLLNKLNETDEVKIRRSEFVLPRKQIFEGQFQNILGKIQREEIEKAVPSVFSVNENVPSMADRKNWLSSLLQTPSNLYAFGLWSQGEGVMGATPEILFHRHGLVLRSMALAGTRARQEGVTPKSLLKDEKERHEHQVVVDDIKKQLSKIGWVKVGDTTVMELPTLLHLMTPIEAEISPKTTSELIRLLHPTPALGVHPRAFGYHWMKDSLEQSQRGWYGAPIAFGLSPEETLCLVAIRQIQWSKSGCRIGVGCGVVKASQVENEWQEIINKLSSVFQLLGLQP